jgi:hypothetical protein
VLPTAGSRIIPSSILIAAPNVERGIFVTPSQLSELVKIPVSEAEKESWHPSCCRT